MNNYDHFVEQLKRKKEILETELKTFAIENPHIKGDFHAKKQPISPDEDDESSQRTIDETLIATEHSLEDQLIQINRAMERVKAEVYGKCGNCNKTIPIKRLNVAPEAEFCLKCQGRKV